MWYKIRVKRVYNEKEFLLLLSLSHHIFLPRGNTCVYIPGRWPEEDKRLSHRTEVMWTTVETQPHLNKRPGPGDMAAASSPSVLLAAARNWWRHCLSPLLLPRTGSRGQLGKTAVTINIKEDKRILCDTETFCSTTVGEMPVYTAGLM
ncbi:uncharacterized protein LOC117083799 [Trachypithecus francoisi]|uniref:uncharacterized protein LOC117083799 n=1 Tax=Trachypithecus francoisi TaxID=54180 RepID=UPI00141BC270|nr:uncharacterized protein LOC117083799 [Trachypithecus francoisi]